MFAIDIMKRKKAAAGGGGGSPVLISAVFNPLVGQSTFGTVTSGNQSFNVVGGVGPFTYETTIETIQNITIVDPTNANPIFRRTACVIGVIYEGVATTTITDTGDSNRTANCNYDVQLERVTDL